MKKSIVDQIKQLPEPKIKGASNLVSRRLQVFEKRGFNGHSINDPKFCSYYASIRKQGRVLKPKARKDGKRGDDRVDLWRGGKVKTFKVSTKTISIHGGFYENPN